MPAHRLKIEDLDLSNPTDRRRISQQRKNDQWRDRNPGKSAANARAYRIQNRSRLLAKEAALRSRLRAMIHALKAAPCMDCGKTFDPVCMDFDHRPGEKKLFTLAEMPGSYRPEAMIMAEIAKCDLVCSNCHRMRTHARRLGPNEFGGQ